MRYQSIFRPDLFKGQVILVTGGGTGIGRAIAHELASLGAQVLLAARKLEPLEQTRDEIAAAHGSASVYLCNIRQEEQITALFAEILAEHGRLDALVNNAGGQFMSPAESISNKGWNAVVETNLTGTFMMCREAYNRCFRERGGRIVNIIVDMWRGFPGMAHTGAARAGVENLTKSLAVEWSRSGVLVNAVAPGLIEGNGILQYGEAMLPFIQAMKKDIPLKRMGTEAECAAAVTFLLSPAAAYISGETIKVDGAYSLWRKTWEIEDHENAPAAYGGFVD
ncbi:MAG: SDR family oxidoreductase [Anaerolineae bacterium]|nr:SDR family oxidoreductase [Anaerolineae bacterium]